MLYLLEDHQTNSPLCPLWSTIANEIPQSERFSDIRYSSTPKLYEPDRWRRWSFIAAKSQIPEKSANRSHLGESHRTVPFGWRENSWLRAPPTTPIQTLNHSAWIATPCHGRHCWVGRDLASCAENGIRTKNSHNFHFNRRKTVRFPPWEDEHWWRSHYHLAASRLCCLLLVLDTLFYEVIRQEVAKYWFKVSNIIKFCLLISEEFLYWFKYVKLYDSLTFPAISCPRKPSEDKISWMVCSQLWIVQSSDCYKCEKLFEKNRSFGTGIRKMNRHSRKSSKPSFWCMVHTGHGIPSPVWYGLFW